MQIPTTMQTQINTWLTYRCVYSTAHLALSKSSGNQHFETLEGSVVQTETLEGSIVQTVVQTELLNLDSTRVTMCTCALLLLGSGNETAALKHGYTRIVMLLETLTVKGSDLVCGSRSRCSHPNIRASEKLICFLVAYRRKDSQVRSTPTVPEFLEPK